MGLPAVFALGFLVFNDVSGSAFDQAAARVEVDHAKGASEVAAKVRTMLLAIRADEPESREVQASRLVGLGTAAIPVLLEALGSGLVPASPEAMDEAREAAAIRALSHRSRAELLQPATALLDRSTRAHTSALVVRLLGAVGDRRELARLCRTARPVSGEIVDGELTDAFEAAATGILTRDVTAWTTAHGLVRSEQDAVRWSLFRALANAASEPTLAVLAAELGVHPDDDVFLLEQLTQASAALPPPLPGSIVAPVRLYLESEQQPFVEKAIRCLAAMEDTESVEELIRLLRKGEPEIVRTAHAALVSITNVGLLPDAERWERWYTEECAWFRDDFPGLAQNLSGGSAVVVVQAISRMAAHPLYRREIAEALTLALEREPAALRWMACSALQQLRAKAAIPFLERCAEDPDPRLALEARRALASFAPPGIAEPAPAPPSDDTQADPDSGR